MFNALWNVFKPTLLILWVLFVLYVGYRRFQACTHHYGSVWMCLA